MFDSRESFNQSWNWLSSSNFRERTVDQGGLSNTLLSETPRHRYDESNYSTHENYRDADGWSNQSQEQAARRNPSREERQYYSDVGHYGGDSFASPLIQASRLRSSTPIAYPQDEPRRWIQNQQYDRMPSRSSGGTIRFQRPPPLQENVQVAERYERWLDWKGVFDVALAVCDDQPSEQQKVLLLFTSVGPETQRTIRLLGLPPMHRGNSIAGREYEELSRGLNSFFRGMVDESIDYARFHEAKQERDEGIHKYSLRLRGLATCVNIVPTSFAFRHQLLKGMRDRELATEAADDSIPLGILIQTAARKEQREMDEASKRLDPWRSEEPRAPTVAAVTSAKGWKNERDRKRPAYRGRDRYPPSKSRQCRYCGGRQH